VEYLLLQPNLMLNFEDVFLPGVRISLLAQADDFPFVSFSLRELRGSLPLWNAGAR
jgi:hypothetical protein